jgi:hypothetical protein
MDEEAGPVSAGAQIVRNVFNVMDSCSINVTTQSQRYSRGRTTHLGTISQQLLVDVAKGMRHWGLNPRTGVLAANHRNIVKFISQ